MTRWFASWAPGLRAAGGEGHGVRRVGRPVGGSEEECLVEKLLVSGGRRLKGSVEISGSKNASLGVMAAALLVPGESVVRHVPRTIDVLTMIDLLRSLGVGVEFSEDGTVTVDATEIKQHSPPYHLARRMRGSFHLAGPLLARLGRVDIGLPGGCTIGSRPVDFHLNGFRALGADVRQIHGRMLGRSRRLHGTKIYLDPRYCSVGATLNLMMAATLADGTTVIENASRDPDVCESARFLVRAGADIEGIGTPTMVIRGVEHLSGPAEHWVYGDRIEAGTFLVAGAVTGGDVTVKGVDPGHFERVIEKLLEAGLDISIGPDQIRAVANRRPSSFDLVTAPHPGFPTDLQPPFVTMACIADGKSVLEEAIFDARLTYIDELRRMNAEIRRVGNSAVVRGVEQLSSAPVRVPDLRAGAALVLAGLCAEGESEIMGVESIDRGYENIEGKLASLGAAIRRVPILGTIAAEGVGA